MNKKAKKSLFISREKSLERSKMPFNEGLLKEEEVIYELNGKKPDELSNNMTVLMKSLFGVLKHDEIIKCYKVDDSFKTDFVIEFDKRRRNVSMKSGKATIVHNEILTNFISFLSKNRISQRTLDTICLFHYGDGTIDGSGKGKRDSYENIIAGLNDRIKEANKELNADLDFIYKIVDRCVFKGSLDDNLEADCVYFGDKDYGIVATKRQFVRQIQKRGFDYFDHLHIGPLLLRPDARYVDKEIADERKRQRIVAYWPHLREDIEYMAKHFNY